MPRSNSKTALIIFAKRPALGVGKQRLAKETRRLTAFLVAKELLKTTLNTVSNFTGDIIISPSNESDIEWSHTLLERSTLCIPQKDGGLGQRLMQVDKEARMLGYRKTIFIGTDAPCLSLDDINKTSDTLNQYGQAYIPASDGGVVLMANKKAWKSLDTVAWSTEKVFSQLKSIAIANGLSFRSFEQQTDLDDLEAYRIVRQSINNPTITQLLDKFIQ